MNSIQSFLANLSVELRYYQIETRDLLTMIRTQTAGSSTGLPPYFKHHEALALGMWQLGVDAFAMRLGVALDTQGFNTRLTRYHTLVEDRDEIVTDIVSALHTQVTQLVPRTVLKHRFAYRILPNYNLLIGLDPREFECEPLQEHFPWDDSLDLL